MINSENNKRLAKNTMMLYIRMLLTMVVALYTSRVVLQVLGVIDFGIYNVVGGIVTMLSFFNSSLTTATQRFLNIEMGKGNIEGLSKIFSMSFICFCLIAIIIIIISETLGLWFLYNKLEIPQNRIEAAVITYHISILVFTINIISIPYNATIIANERMEAYAYVSIIDVSLKLGLVYLLSTFNYDKLVVFSILNLVVTLIITNIYIIYCQRKFKECSIKWFWDKNLFQQIISFSGWMFSGTMTNTLSTQGVNMLINIYFGPALNAARAISMQVNGAVNSFVTNFMTAAKPQIVKYYASNDLEQTYKLVYSTSKLSFYLLFLLSLPILLETNYILSLWLKTIPEYSELFTQLVIIELLITSAYSPIAFVSQASGRIRNYQLIISVGFILIFMCSWFLYKLGFPAYTTFIISIVIAFLGLFARLIEIHFSIHFPSLNYLKKVFLPIIIIIIASTLITIVVSNILLVESILGLIRNTIIYSAVSIGFIYLIGLDKAEKYMFCKFIKKLKK